MGWVTAFLWPVPVFFLLFLFRMSLGNVSAETFITCFVALTAVAVFVQALCQVGKWLSHPREGLYDCPVCGHNVVKTPHRCPCCGTRLIWGYLPGPGDGCDGQFFVGEHRGRLAV